MTRAVLALLWCAAAASAQPVQLTYFGTAGWRIAGGKTVILIDPYFTRVKMSSPNDDVSPDDARPQERTGSREEQGIAGAFDDPVGFDFVEKETEDESGGDARAYVGIRRGEDDAEDIHAPRAESQTDSEFVGPVRDSVGYDAVESDGGQDQREGREDSEQRCDQTLLGESG
jgi:hypothetical protein